MEKIPVDKDIEVTLETLDLDQWVVSHLKAERQRIAELEKTEWQRWVPGLGTYRLIKDEITGDQSRLDGMHNLVYNSLVSRYNIVVGSVSLFLIAAGLYDYCGGPL
ncbi:MAG TPA: hypothetical protein VJC39_04885 [Candidatus Nanoarchaeia archaeon]|nr:hypothetical protein [Candidatus Nanoarchaeia archaeon]